MKYDRLTKQAGWHKDIDLKDELGYSYIYQRLAELENKIEQGTLIDTNNWFIEKEDNHGKVRYLICKYDKLLTISDFADTREEAEKRLEELKGGKE